MKKTITLLLILFCTSVFSQQKLNEFELFRVSYTNFSRAKIKSDFSQVKDDKIRIEEYRINFNYPIVSKDKKTILINGISYVNMKPVYNFNTTFTNETSENYYSISYNLGLVKRLKKDWTITALVSPTLASDFNGELKSDDFILQASAIATKQVSKNLNYGFGLSYNTRFGQPLVVPILQLTYVKNKWKTVVIFPGIIGEFYQFNKNNTVGLLAAINGSQFNISTKETVLDNLNYTRVNFGPSYERSIYKDLKINLFTGYTLAKKISWSTFTKGDIDLKPENSYFFQISLRYVK
ncbi:DUF6268 family outer membrane beta-barrel protein [Aureivirga sp. CE67]|uniref:DUF6268 family outer membrane beta-barrel protein n=1 Tax=Aureivirga sp. CE67 TaxID=1788983 RepID=UPI0018C8E08D|nr:DUF6268 family outer membrane beta-barrel protein [Aureivirga sp. CE67]